MTNVEIPNGLPILSVGSHERGSGRACIMNAISYLKGDTDITDYPDCVHPLLARAAQMINDSICPSPVKDAMGEEVLCPSCAHEMWLFGSRLMGTGFKELQERQGIHTIYARETAWVDAFVTHVERVFDTVLPQMMEPEPDIKLTQVLNLALSAIEMRGHSSSKPEPPLTAEMGHLALGYKLLDLYNEIVDPSPRETVDWSQETYETVATEGKIPVYAK